MLMTDTTTNEKSENPKTDPSNESGILLDYTDCSNNWDILLSHAVPYMPQKGHYPSLIIPVLDQHAALIISDSTCYSAPNQTFDVLKSNQHVLQSFDYFLLARALKYFKCFGLKLLPMMNRTACLFPVSGSIDNAIWVNPLKIYDVIEEDDQTELVMTDGSIMRSFETRRTFDVHATIALLALATMRRDFLHPDIPGQYPSDYLELPNTPFLRFLNQQEELQEFPLPQNALKQRYEDEQSIQRVLKIGKKLNMQGLTYPYVSDILNNVK
ncbi:hypothetical protein JZO70_20380 [Enterococcus sp. 669A]|uniref:Uncharacterized protein n=1 Tax=Candidatus Enterococcus moelleringii TaxID=2815325 RepID=A0ABS3LFW7_9ENTE|nr:hypothetical protein [Enterococcus sp. 669A]MBO1308543.1 hypothetical protein [Enterococcus sp. 669A]